MPTELLPVAGTAHPPRSRAGRAEPDPAFDALPRLTQLRDALRSAPPARRSRWGEPAVFFFDQQRQAELAHARSQPAATADPLTKTIEEELPGLVASAEVRRAARGVSGLKDAAADSALPAAKELAALLAVPDDETILVLHPASRTGLRVLVRGVADVHQFHILLADAAGDSLPGSRPPSRLVTACRAVDPVSPAGVPMIAEGRFQMFKQSSVQSDGSLPLGFRGSDHWLWGKESLAVIPRIDGERVVLLGEPAYRQTWEVERRFPGLAADVRLLEVLNPFAVAERLGRLAGQPVSVVLNEPRAEKAAA